MKISFHHFYLLFKRCAIIFFPLIVVGNYLVYETIVNSDILGSRYTEIRVVTPCVNCISMAHLTNYERQQDLEMFGRIDSVHLKELYSKYFRDNITKRFFNLAEFDPDIPHKLFYEIIIKSKNKYDGMFDDLDSFVRWYRRSISFDFSGSDVHVVTFRHNEQRVSVDMIVGIWETLNRIVVKDLRMDSENELGEFYRSLSQNVIESCRPSTLVHQDNDLFVAKCRASQKVRRFSLEMLTIFLRSSFYFDTYSVGKKEYQVLESPIVRVIGFISFFNIAILMIWTFIAFLCFLWLPTGNSCLLARSSMSFHPKERVQGK